MIIPEGYAQINAIHTGTSLPTGAEWTLGVKREDFVGDVTDIAQAFEAALLASTLYGNVSLGVTMSSVLVKEGPNSTGASVIEPANEPGTNGNQASPNTAFLIRKETELGGRAGRGRFYLPGVPDANINPNGTLVSGVTAALQTDLDALYNALVAVELIPVVLHNAGSPLIIPTEITRFAPQSVAATQRRRLRR
jgi:hypothetical protein